MPPGGRSSRPLCNAATQFPDQAPGDCVAMLQDDKRAVGPRRDRSRSALDRHDRLEVQRTAGLERLGLGQEGERADLEETT